MNNYHYILNRKKSDYPSSAAADNTKTGNPNKDSLINCRYNTDTGISKQLTAGIWRSESG